MVPAVGCTPLDFISAPAVSTTYMMDIHMCYNTLYGTGFQQIWFHTLYGTVFGGFEIPTMTISQECDDDHQRSIVELKWRWFKSRERVLETSGNVFFYFRPIHLLEPCTSCQKLEPSKG